MNNTQQLLPGFSFRMDADFEHFFAINQRGEVKNYLLHYLQQDKRDCIYLSGAENTGKSHLLQAACNTANEMGRSAFYLPLAELLDYPAESVLEGMKQVDLLCIDDVHLVQQQADWQEALFHLYNLRLAKQLPIFFAANAPVRLLEFSLPDLQSRLAACLAFALPAMSDDEKVLFLQDAADKRGMQLAENCASYIVQHYGRGVEEIVQILQRLDQASLIEKRKITIPFIKESLS